MENRYRLGLDVGTNSLGWCVLELDNKSNPDRIEATGVRIFSDGRGEESKATLAATRREKRSARRLRDRFKQRQAYLLKELTDAGLFPKDERLRKELEKLNPLELRAKALTERLAPYEVGRALFHLNQRRGFKNNRKDRSKEAEDRQKALTAPSDKIELTYGSFGSFLWQRQQNGLPVRARPDAGADGKLYDVYPARELYEQDNQACADRMAGIVQRQEIKQKATRRSLLQFCEFSLVNLSRTAYSHVLSHEQA